MSRQLFKGDLTMSGAVRTILLSAMREHLEGKINYHRANIEVYLINPAGIGEHPDIMESIESELAKLAEATEKRDILDKYFG